MPLTINSLCIGLASYGHIGGTETTELEKNYYPDTKKCTSIVNIFFWQEEVMNHHYEQIFKNIKNENFHSNLDMIQAILLSKMMLYRCK